MADEVKSLVNDLGRAFEEFKSSNDERLAQIEKSNKADPLLVEQVEKANNHISELEKKLSDVEKVASRKAAEKAKDDVDIEFKAAQFADIVSKKRGRQIDVDVELYTTYNKALIKYMREGQDALDMDERKALSVGSDPDGGFTVTPDISGRIVEKMFETSPMRQVAAVQAINSDALEGLYDLDEASSGWVSEQGARTETDTPELGKWGIPTHEQYAMPTATQKLLDDSGVNIEQWLAGKVQDKFARTENAAFVNGDGVGKPRGFLTYAAGTTLPGTIQQFPTGASGAFEATGSGGDVFFDLVYGMKAAYRSGGRWAMNRSTLAEVRKIKDSDGNYIWQLGLQAGQPSTIAGYPVIDFEDMPDIAADSLSVAFANFGEAYQIVDRLGTRILRDPYSNKPYIQFYTTKRTGGDVLNFEAIKLMKFAVS